MSKGDEMDDVINFRRHASDPEASTPFLPIPHDQFARTHQNVLPKRTDDSGEEEEEES